MQAPAEVQATVPPVGSWSGTGVTLSGSSSGSVSLFGTLKSATVSSFVVTRSSTGSGGALVLPTETVTRPVSVRDPPSRTV